MAIVLSAVVTGIAVPMTAQYMKRYQLNGAASNLAFEISRAKMQAVGENRYVRVYLDSGSGSYWREVSSNGITWTQDGNKTKIPTGATMFYSGTHPKFNNMGLMTPSLTVTVVLMMPGVGAKTITTNALGRVKITGGTYTAG